VLSNPKNELYKINIALTQIAGRLDITQIDYTYAASLPIAE